MLNDEVFMEAARALGQWAADRNGAVDSTVERLFLRCLSRPPSESERYKLTKFYHQQLQRFKSSDLKATEFLKAENPSNEQAAWAALARVILNLDETITKE